jgi:hypothetical protein
MQAQVDSENDPIKPGTAKTGATESTLVVGTVVDWPNSDGLELVADGKPVSRVLKSGKAALL